MMLSDDHEQYFELMYTTIQRHGYGNDFVLSAVLSGGSVRYGVTVYDGWMEGDRPKHSGSSEMLWIPAWWWVA